MRTAFDQRDPGDDADILNKLLCKRATQVPPQPLIDEDLPDDALSQEWVAELHSLLHKTAVFRSVISKLPPNDSRLPIFRRTLFIVHSLATVRRCVLQVFDPSSVLRLQYPSLECSTAIDNLRGEGCGPSVRLEEIWLKGNGWGEEMFAKQYRRDCKGIERHASMRRICGALFDIPWMRRRGDDEIQRVLAAKGLQ
jgi:hypothetical protein